MRFAVPLYALLCALSLPTAALAAISLEAPPSSPERPAVEQSQFTEGGSERYERERNFRLQEQRRSIVRNQARGLALIVVPVVLIVLVTFLFVKAKTGDRHRSTRRKLKQAEVRRRAGGPEQMLDPRQW